jgi:hypothetical protein
MRRSCKSCPTWAKSVRNVTRRGGGSYPEVMASAADLLVENLRGKLDGQLAALESARTRAAAALSVAGVVAGLFGPGVLKSPGNLGLAAIGCLVASAVPAIYVLVPHRLVLWPQGDGWRTWLTDYARWAEEHQQPDNSQALLESRMLDDMAVWYARNKPALDRIQWALAMSFAFVVAQILFWALGAFTR